MIGIKYVFSFFCLLAGCLGRWSVLFICRKKNPPSSRTACLVRKKNYFLNVFVAIGILSKLKLEDFQVQTQEADRNSVLLLLPDS